MTMIVAIFLKNQDTYKKVNMNYWFETLYKLSGATCTGLPIFYENTYRPDSIHVCKIAFSIISTLLN
jgi:hypothetical protein